MYGVQVCEIHPAFLTEPTREDSLRLLKCYVMTQFGAKHCQFKKRNGQFTTADVELSSLVSNEPPATLQNFLDTTTPRPVVNNRDPTPSFGTHMFNGAEEVDQSPNIPPAPLKNRPQKFVVLVPRAKVRQGSIRSEHW
jgi:hypothetical protein